MAAGSAGCAVLGRRPPAAAAAATLVVQAADRDSGRPLPHPTATLAPLVPQPRAADGGGSVVFAGLHPGRTYALTVRHPGYSQALSVAVTPPCAGQTDTVRLALARPCDLDCVARLEPGLAPPCRSGRRP